MGFEDKSTFGILDYCFFAAMLLISTLIGVIAAFKGNKSPEEFLMGNRAFRPIPIAMSLITSFVSSIGLLSFAGETYAYGMQIVWFIPGIVLGIGSSALTATPVLHQLKLISINEYIELRFKSLYLRKLISAVSIVNLLIIVGPCLYAPSLALSAVTPLSSTSYIFILGAVVTFYSSIGGIKAVVWADMFQLIVMLLGLLIINGVGVYVAGRPSTVWNTAMAGRRLEIFNLDLGIYTRHTLWNCLIGGFTFACSLFGTSQVYVQRLCSLPSVRDAYTVLGLSALGMTIFFFLIFLSGTVAYVIYAGCDPFALGIIGKKDGIMPYMVLDKLDFITGLPGIYVATIIGGGLSTISSMTNAVAAMIWKDFLSKLQIFVNVKPTTAGMINKLLSFGVGVISLGIAILASKTQSLVRFTITLASMTSGPIYGVFMLGLIFPKTNMKGIWTGLVFSLVFIGWISLGSLLYAPSQKTLPFSTEKCVSPSLNVSESKEFTTNNATYPKTPDNDEAARDDSFEDFPLMYLYGISYVVHGAIGITVCIVVAVIVSCVTGNEKLSKVPREYIAPCVRLLYWSKEELKELLKEELKDYAMVDIIYPLDPQTQNQEQNYTPQITS